MLRKLQVMYPQKGSDSNQITYAFDRDRFNDMDRLQVLSALKSLVSNYKTYVKTEIDNVKTVSMVDSGNSAFSSINKELAEALEIGPDDLESVDGRDSIGTAKAESRMKILGRTKKEFELSLSPSLPPIRTKLVVLPELGMPCNISGIDLERYAITIVTGKHLLYKGVKIPLVTRRDFGPELTPCSPQVYTINSATRCPVFTSCDVVVQPFEQVHISAVTLNGRGGDEEAAGSLRPSLDLSDKFNLLPWKNAVVTLRHDETKPGNYSACKVGLINVNHRPIKVPRGTYYGEVELISPIMESPEGRIAEIGEIAEAVNPTAPESNPSVTLKTKPPITSKSEEQYQLPPSPDKQNDIMAGDDIKLPDWMVGETNCKNWGKRYDYLRQLFKTRGNPNLQQPERERRFLALLLSHWQLFAWDGTYGKTSLVKHYINTPPGGKPVNERYRPPNPVLSQSLKKQIEKWLKHGCIEPSDSAWNSNLLAVVKSNSSTEVRWCIDYRRLNSETKVDRFPIGNIEDNLSRLGKSKLFSCLDNSGAFHVIEIAPEDRHKTSFSSPFNTWQFTRLPFGLAGGPSSYARLVLQVLRNIPPDVAVAYVDDILIHSETFAQHLTNLDLVLNRYAKAGLKLNPAKCNFVATEINYLGHLVSPEGIKPQEAYLKIVRSWPVPKSRHDVSVFLGKTGYYRKFCKGYAKIAGPLTNLLKLPDEGKELGSQPGPRTNSSAPSGVRTKPLTSKQEKIILSKSQRRKKMEEPITLTKAELQSFHQLRDMLCSSAVLSHPRFDDLTKEPFVLDSDWCSETNTCAGILNQVQIQPNGEKVEKVIGYSSKKLNKSQANYSSPKGEICSILLAIEAFRYFLLAGRFLIRTDNMAAKALKDNTQPSGYLSRWKSRLASYDFELIHRAGTKHGNADSLSRISHAEPLNENEDVFDEKTDRQYLFSMHWEAINAVDEDESKQMTREEQWTPSYIREVQEEDHDLSLLRQWVKGGELPTTNERAQSSRDLKSYINLFSDLYLDDDEVLRYRYSKSPVDEGFDVISRQLIVLPTSALEDAVRLIHEKSAHVGVQNTIESSLHYVYGFDLRDIAEHVCRTCLICQQKTGTVKKNDHTLYVPKQGYPMQTLNLDIVGPLCPSKHKRNEYILTIQCAFTRWLEAFPLKRATGANVVRVLVTDIFPRFGYPSFIKVDRGTHFLNSEMYELMRGTSIKLLTSPSYHPQSNQIERSHRTLKDMLKAMILDLSGGDPSSWESHLPACLFAFRCLRNKRTKYSPFELLFLSKPQTELSLIFGAPPDRKEYSSKSEYVRAHQQHLQQAYQWANDNIEGELRRARKYHYSHPSRTFQVGQKVWLLTPVVRPGQRRSFISPWSGPWTIEEVKNAVTYKIGPHSTWSRTKSEVVSADRLKPYVSPEGEGEEWEETHPPSMTQDLSLSTDTYVENIPLAGDWQGDDDEDDDVGRPLQGVGQVPVFGTGRQAAAPRPAPPPPPLQFGGNQRQPRARQPQQQRPPPQQQQPPRQLGQPQPQHRHQPQPQPLLPQIPLPPPGQRQQDFPLQPPPRDHRHPEQRGRQLPGPAHQAPDEPPGDHQPHLDDVEDQAPADPQPHEDVPVGGARARKRRKPRPLPEPRVLPHRTAGQNRPDNKYRPERRRHEHGGDDQSVDEIDPLDGEIGGEEAVGNEFERSSGHVPDLADQSVVLKRRRENAERNDTRTKRQKRQQFVLDQLRHTKAKLETQGKILSMHKSKLDANLSRLRKCQSAAILSPSRVKSTITHRSVSQQNVVAPVHSDSEFNDDAYQREYECLTNELHSPPTQNNSQNSTAASLVQKLTNLQPSSTRLSLVAHLNKLQQRNLSAPPRLRPSQIPRACSPMLHNSSNRQIPPRPRSITPSRIPRAIFARRSSVPDSRF